MCKELNAKFKLHAIVKPHKQKYYIIYIPASDAPVLCSLLENHLPKLKASTKNLSIKQILFYSFLKNKCFAILLINFNF